MNEKMQVIFFKHTSHALAAFTRTADPEGKPSIENLVGDGIEARNKATVPAPRNRERDGTGDSRRPRRCRG